MQKLDPAAVPGITTHTSRDDALDRVVALGCEVMATRVKAIYAADAHILYAEAVEGYTIDRNGVQVLYRAPKQGNPARWLVCLGVSDVVA